MFRSSIRSYLCIIYVFSAEQQVWESLPPEYLGQKNDEGIRSTFRYKIWLALIITVGAAFSSSVFRKAADSFVSDGRKRRK